MRGICINPAPTTNTDVQQLFTYADPNTKLIHNVRAC
jgi:hypothetical protein